MGEGHGLRRDFPGGDRHRRIGHSGRPACAHYHHTCNRRAARIESRAFSARPSWMKPSSALRMTTPSLADLTFEAARLNTNAKNALDAGEVAGRLQTYGSNRLPEGT